MTWFLGVIILGFELRVSGVGCVVAVAGVAVLDLVSWFA